MQINYSLSKNTQQQQKPYTKQEHQICPIKPTVRQFESNKRNTPSQIISLSNSPPQDTTMVCSSDNLKRIRQISGL